MSNIEKLKQIISSNENPYDGMTPQERNLSKIIKAMELLQYDTITPKQVKEFLKVVLNTIKISKDSFDKLSAENIQTIKDSIAYIEENYTKWENTQDTKSNAMVGQMEAKMTLLKGIIEKALAQKPANGKDADETKIVAEVLSKIPKVEPITAKNLRDKLESLGGEERLDVTAINNLPKFTVSRDAPDNPKVGDIWCNLS